MMSQKYIIWEWINLNYRNIVVSCEFKYNSQIQFLNNSQHYVQTKQATARRQNFNKFRRRVEIFLYDRQMKKEEIIINKLKIYYEQHKIKAML